MDEYLTLKEASALMRISRRTVLRWTQMGRIRPIRVGRTVRFSKAHLIRQMERYEYGDSEGHDPAMG